MSKLININNREKIACITLDIEEDYGGRIGEFNIFKSHKEKILELSGLFSDLKVPISAFVATKLLVDYPGSLDTIKMIADDYHCHSHTHRLNTDNRQEIERSSSMFREYFGYQAFGYRAPRGILCDRDIDYIKDFGFKFSSSVFPSFRPGAFNNLTSPAKPFFYDNDIMELPFSAVPGLRYIVSLSYLKLIGMKLNRLLFSIFGLPSIIVFDSHLHDFIFSKESFDKLPNRLKFAWGINRSSGVKFFVEFIELLKQKEYKFITMTDLYNKLKDSSV